MQKVTVALVLFFLALGIVSAIVVSSYFEEHIETVLVTKMFIDPSKDSGSHYVLTTDKGVFEVDRPLNKITDPDANPDKIWGQLHEGKFYKISYLGWRIDFAYQYPFVFHVEEVDEPKNNSIPGPSPPCFGSIKPPCPSSKVP